MKELPSKILIVDDDAIITAILIDAMKVLYPGATVSRCLAAPENQAL